MSSAQDKNFASAFAPNLLTPNNLCNNRSCAYCTGQLSVSGAIPGYGAGACIQVTNNGICYILLGYEKNKGHYEGPCGKLQGGCITNTIRAELLEEFGIDISANAIKNTASRAINGTIIHLVRLSNFNNGSLNKMNQMARDRQNSNLPSCYKEMSHYVLVKVADVANNSQISSFTKKIVNTFVNDGLISCNNNNNNNNQVVPIRYVNEPDRCPTCNMRNKSCKTTKKTYIVVANNYYNQERCVVAIKCMSGAYIPSVDIHVGDCLHCTYVNYLQSVYGFTSSYDFKVQIKMINGVRVLYSIVSGLSLQNHFTTPCIWVNNNCQSVRKNSSGQIVATGYHARPGSNSEMLYRFIDVIFA